MQSIIKLSAVLIVKNEEAMLARCLESVACADEIIVVDTGSVDRTKDIARKFTDKVFDYAWNDDFAAARNFGIDQATGNWILSIDADEFLEERGIEKINSFLRKYQKEAASVQMTAPNNVFSAVRLFKRDESVYWKGKIHETLNILDYDKSDIQITYESSPSHSYDPDRNFRILKNLVEDDESDARVLFYLGTEYGYRGDWGNCIKNLEIYISISNFLKEKADAYFVLALAYWNIQMGDNARAACLNAICINANFKAVIQLMGHMSFERNKVQWDRMAETATNENTLFARINFLTI